MLAAAQHRMMLDSRGDNVAALGAQEPRGAQNCQVGTFCSTGSKYDFAGFGAQDLRGAFASVIELGPGLATDVVHARGIAPDFAQERQHRLPDLRVQGRGGIVIEIDCLHDAGFV